MLCAMPNSTLKAMTNAMLRATTSRTLQRSGIKFMADVTVNSIHSLHLLHSFDNSHDVLSIMVSGTPYLLSAP